MVDGKFAGYWCLTNVAGLMRQLTEEPAAGHKRVTLRPYTKRSHAPGIDYDCLGVGRGSRASKATSRTYGGYTVGFEATPPTPTSALFAGLPDDRCQSAHWGLRDERKAHLQDPRRREETFEAGDAYYARPATSPSSMPAPRSSSSARRPELAADARGRRAEHGSEQQLSSEGSGPRFGPSVTPVLLKAAAAFLSDAVRTACDRVAQSRAALFLRVLRAGRCGGVPGSLVGVASP